MFNAIFRVIMPPMPERFLRVYKKFHLDEIKCHLLVYGVLSGSCANCKKLDLKLDARQCPECGTGFKFIAFQNVRDHWPKIHKIAQENPGIIFVDYDDFKKIDGEEKAKNILG